MDSHCACTGGELSAREVWRYCGAPASHLEVEPVSQQLLWLMRWSREFLLMAESRRAAQTGQLGQ